MIYAVLLDIGIAALFFGLVFLVRPVPRLGIHTRAQAGILAAAGIALMLAAVFAPAPDLRASRVSSRLDELSPVWQFDERHTIAIAASPERVYDAILHVRADEIALFRTLTWIRRGGRDTPQSILNPGDRDSIIDVATRSGFIRLADDAPHELVVGAAVVVPKAARGGKLTPALFGASVPPGFALAAMNFLVTPDGHGGSLVSTETRVFASSPRVRRRFAAYWRTIYPGSALIRRMWLRAIARRALSSPNR